MTENAETTNAIVIDIRTKEERRAAELIAAGFVQTSRKYRMLARVPAGMTPLEALRQVDPDTAASLEKRMQEWCAEHYRRCFARGDDSVTLSIEEFAAFLRLTGRGTAARSP